MLSHLGFAYLVVEFVHLGQDRVGRVFVGSEGLVTVDELLPELRIAEQRGKPTHADVRNTEEVGAIVGASVEGRQAPEARAEAAIVGLGRRGAARAQAAVAVPKRTLLETLVTVLVEITAEPVAVDVEGNDVGDEVVDPLIRIDVLGVARELVGVAREAEVGKEVQEIGLDPTDLRQNSRIGCPQSVVWIIENELGRGGSDGPNLRHRPDPFVRVRPIDPQHVAAGNGDGIGVLGLQRLDVETVVVAFGFFLEQVEAEIIIRGHRPGVDLAEDFYEACAGGGQANLLAKPVEDGVVHQARVEAVDAVEHPVGLGGHAQNRVVEVLVEFFPCFDREVGLELGAGAGATGIDAHAGLQVREIRQGAASAVVVKCHEDASLIAGGRNRAGRQHVEDDHRQIGTPAEHVGA